MQVVPKLKDNKIIATHSKRTLLLVDDEISVRNSLKRLLRNEAYDILSAADAREGLSLLRTHQVHVILCDERMPYMPGHEFLTQAQKVAPKSIRIMLSGYADFEAIAKAVNHAEIYRFLPKPWNDEHLTLELRKAFEQQALSYPNDNIPIANKVDAEPLKADLSEAIDTQALGIALQPQLDIKSGKIIGCEALSRWRHSKLGNISPSEYIPLAEKNGLAVKLDMYMLEAACSAIVNINADRPVPLRISVNITADQLLLTQLISQIERLSESLDLMPTILELEITERRLLQDLKFCRSLFRELLGLGVRVSLDDFGTGYSSIQYLDKLPVSAIKIDKSFIRGLPSSKKQREIVRTLILLAHNLGIEVVAEGVENEEEFQFLRDNKCDLIQGFWFSKPLSVEKFSTLVDINSI